MEGNNETTTCADKCKQTSSAYDIKGKKKTSITSEKKENSWGGNVRIYECGNFFCTSTFKRTCAAQETTINKMKDNEDMYKSETE